MELEILPSIFKNPRQLKAAKATLDRAQKEATTIVEKVDELFNRAVATAGRIADRLGTATATTTHVAQQLEMAMNADRCKMRFYRDSNSDRWIQSPKCSPLHHRTSHNTACFTDTQPIKFPY